MEAQILTDAIAEAIKVASKNYYRLNETLFSLDFTTPEKIAENISEMAADYWNARTQSEIERDEQLGIYVEDYERFCSEAWEQIADEM